MFNTKRINQLEVEVDRLKNEITPAEKKDFYGESIGFGLNGLFFSGGDTEPTIINRLEALEDKLDVLLDYLSLDISKRQPFESEFVCTNMKKFWNGVKRDSIKNKKSKKIAKKKK